MDFRLQFIDYCSPRSATELARDHGKVTREITHGKRILPSHARILAKAIEYWKLRYNEKYIQWHRSLRKSDFTGGIVKVIRKDE